MKKLLFLIPIILLLASCQPYGDKIKSRFVSQQGHWVPVKDSAGDVIKNNLVFDSSYTIVPSTRQKYALAKKNGRLTVCYIFLALAIGLIVFGIIFLSGGGKPIGLVAFPAAIICFLCAVGSIDWAVTKEADIPKTTYDSLKATPDGLKPFWDENLYK